jgi:hypothetical protein
MTDDLHWKFWKQESKKNRKNRHKPHQKVHATAQAEAPAVLSKATTSLGAAPVVTIKQTPPAIERRHTLSIAELSSPVLRELGDMLSYKRAAYSLSEEEFLEKYVDSLPGAKMDSYGNRYVVVEGGNENIMFSCHSDTVHRSGGRQQVLYDPHLKHFFKADGMPLGADDGVGVWLMRNMVKAGVPGFYVFHQGEEIGGQGSSYIAEYEQEVLKKIDIAIAFDRRGTKDIITHQAGGRCCSDRFAADMAKLLGNGYVACSGGIFTDTANYTSHVSECTNLSVGYYNEHTQNEYLDVSHAENLLAALLAADWSKLKAYRDPATTESLYDSYYKTYGVKTKIDKKESKRVSYDTIVSFVHNNPVAAADILYDFGVTADDLDYAVQFYKRNF